MLAIAISLSTNVASPLLFSHPRVAIAPAQASPGGSRQLATGPSSTTNRTGVATGRSPTACPEVPIPLTALIPIEQEEVKTNGQTLKYSLGKTAAPRPKLWIYMPYTTANGFEVELAVLQEGRTDQQWQRSLRLPQTPGIIRVSLPGDMPELAVGQFYKWTLTVKCNPVNPISGWMERVSDPVSPNLEGLAKATAYAQAAIWYDALTVLGDLRRNGSPAAQKSAFEAWKKLLKDSPILLPDLATQEIVPY